MLRLQSGVDYFAVKLTRSTLGIVVPLSIAIPVPTILFLPSRQLDQSKRPLQDRTNKYNKMYI